MASRRKSSKHATPRKPAARAPHAPTVPATTRETAGSLGRARSTGGLPAHAPASVAGAAHALELAAGTAHAGLADVILELAGADRAGLRATLAAWQREQDRVLNRAWRRPGGLARPAGL